MKTTYIVLIFALYFNTIVTKAQTKVGTINSEYILASMPESKIVGERAKEYGAKLDSSFTIKLTDYKTRLANFQKKEKEMGELEKKTFIKELTSLENDIKKYQSNGQKLIQLKQNELLRPLYKKLSNAIQEIAKEHNYTQILTLSGNDFAYIDEQFDITNLVLEKLGITIPEITEEK